MTKKGWNSKMDLGFPLPEDHIPTGRVCVTFEIPDDRVYAQDVVGHIMQLGKWWNWEKAGGVDRRATETAQLFRTAIYETLCVEKYREMGCKCEDKATFLHRVTSDGALEVSKDDGATWEPDPTDPRLTAPQLPPLPGEASDAKRCAAATNVTAHFREKGDQLAANAELWSSISVMIGALIGLLLFLEIIGTGGALTPVVLAFGGALLAGGRAAFIAAMTEDAYDKFRCIVYCEMTDDGVLKAGGLAAIKSKVNEQLTGIATTFFNGTVDLMGEIGINNMAKTGSGVEADCTDCDDCFGCGSSWNTRDPMEPFYGTIVERGEGYMIVDFGLATDPGGSHYVWVTGEDEHDCCNVSVEALAGGWLDGNNLWVDCGQPDVNIYHASKPIGESMWSLLIKTTVPGSRVKINFS